MVSVQGTFTLTPALHSVPCAPAEGSSVLAAGCHRHRGSGCMCRTENLAGAVAGAQDLSVQRLWLAGPEGLQAAGPSPCANSSAAAVSASTCPWHTSPCFT